MLLGPLFDAFVRNSPIPLMFRGALERALSTEDLEQLFKDTAEQQYTRKLLFSSVVDVMSLVVCRVRPTVHASYQALKDRLGVSARALYDKLDHLEPGISAALVQHSANKMLPVLQELQGGLEPLLPGYRVRILDGNHLAATQHRLKELRHQAAGPLPGQSLAVLDPQWRLITNVILEEDGHAQERSLLPQVLALVEANDVWVGDRNFCTTAFLFGIQDRLAYFVIRQHAQNAPCTLLGRRRRCGRCDTGMLYEQTVEFRDEQDRVLRARRITLVLDQPTRDGDTEIHLFTNLPADVAAAVVAKIYRQRWSIEIAFGELTTTLACELDTLAYPKAALFAFAVAVVAYNVLSLVKGALRAVHGRAKIEQELSSYYVAEEVAGTYRGMMIANPDEQWLCFGEMSTAKMARVLKQLAQQVNLAAFCKPPRGPKKPPTKKHYDKHKPHVSTARILARRAILLK